MSVNSFPDELLSIIIKDIVHDTTIAPRATRAGIQCALETGALNSFSMTSSRLRRLALPTLFRSVRVSLGFLAPNTVTMDVAPSTMEKFRNAVRLNSHVWGFVHEMSIVGGRGRFGPFVVDILKAFVNLERLNIPTSVWNDAAVMENIDNHLILKEVYLPGKGWENEPVPYSSLRKVTWKTFFLSDTSEGDQLQSYFEAGLTVWDVTIIREDFEWTPIVFTGMTTLTIDGENFTQDQREEWEEFVNMQPALVTMKIMQPSPECFVFPTTTWLRTHLENQIEHLAIAECELHKTDGEWVLTKLEATIEVEDSDQYEAVTQGILLGGDSLEMLDLKANEEFESRKSFVNFFRGSFPTLSTKIIECNIFFPHTYGRQAGAEAAARLGLPTFPAPDYSDLARKEVLRLAYDLVLPCPDLKRLTFDLPNVIHNPNVSSGADALYVMPVWNGMTLKVHRGAAHHKRVNGVGHLSYVLTDEYWQPPEGTTESNMVVD